jgi:hypothetical protein
MLEFIFLLAGIAIGFNLKHKPETIIQDPVIRNQLAVAKNLNESLYQDLQEAKEALWKLKNKKDVK